MDLRLNEYGEDRLHEFAANHRTVSADTLLRKIIADVQEFVGEAPQTDDMTMIVLQRSAA